jgi:hypothetical protein
MQLFFLKLYVTYVVALDKLQNTSSFLTSDTSQKSVFNPIPGRDWYESF